MTEDEMAGWHHWLNGCESEWTLGAGDGQAWRAAIHGVAKSQTWLSDCTELHWTLLYGIANIYRTGSKGKQEKEAKEIAFGEK